MKPKQVDNSKNTKRNFIYVLPGCTDYLLVYVRIYNTGQSGNEVRTFNIFYCS